MALDALTNTITNPGGQGLNLDTTNAATVTSAISMNTITGSALETIHQTALEETTLNSIVTNNVLAGADPLVHDFITSVTASSRANGGRSNACLELVNNGSANPLDLADFEVIHDLGVNPDTTRVLFQFFESGNDTAAVRTGPITSVAAGTCGVPINGAALFVVNCAACHTGNGLGNGNVGPNLTNATVAMINAQLINNPTMSALLTRGGILTLTAQEIQAIAAALVAP
jgi:hypothetical protein